jgi:hypothetical protein
MPAQAELQANASVFGVIAEVRMNERPNRNEPVNETQLETLAYEIARGAGRERLLAA